MSSHLVVAVVGVEAPEAGGAHNAETLMLGQIKKSLNNNEIIIIEHRKTYARPKEDFKRLGGYLRSLYFLWKSIPVTWSLARRFTWIQPSKFERELLRKNVDVVFFVGLYDRAIELKRIPFIATIWDLGHRDLPLLPEMSANREFELREWAIKNIAIKATAIVVDSEITKVKLKAYYGIEDSKIHALPFAPNMGGDLPKGERESFALYPAHYWSHKNHLVLFDAIVSLLSKGEKPRHLKLTGLDRGNFDYLSKKVIELQISEYVEFLGFVTKSELDSLYRQAAIVVMPSMLGPTNLPPLEALLHGCPIAVNNSAIANLGDWSGVLELDGFDTQSWAEVLNIKSIFEKVNISEIQQHLFECEESNVQQLKMLFDDFKRIKRMHA